MPSINRLHREYEARGLTALLVAIREAPEEVARAVARRRYVAPVVLDRGGEVTERYEVTGTPTAYLIGRDGRIRGRAVGPRPWTAPAGRALLLALLALPGRRTS